MSRHFRFAKVISELSDFVWESQIPRLYECQSISLPYILCHKLLLFYEYSFDLTSDNKYRKLWQKNKPKQKGLAVTREEFRVRSLGHLMISIIV